MLNVWTPGAGDGAARPVLVWLHGGGMSVGSASWPLYDFTNLARNNDVVVVGINHRLGVLGFLDVSHLGDEFADSGNVGMLDIVAALEWVRDNIAQFGGDPANVTIFGESGGGSKVTCLLGMPSAQGLFRSAFAMSGAMLDARTPEAARETSDLMLERLGVGTDVEALRKLDVEAYVQASLDVSGWRRRPRTASAPPSVPAFRATPSDAVRAGSAADVNVVLGCTTHEMVAFMGSPELWTADEESVRQMLNGMVGDDGSRVFERYLAARPDDSPASLFLLIASDSFMRIPHIRYAEALLDGGATNPRLYLFDFRRPSPDGVERAGTRLRHAVLLRQPRQGTRLRRPARRTTRPGDERRAHRTGAIGRPEPRRPPVVAGLLDVGAADDALRRGVARRDRSDVRGAAALDQLIS